MHHEPHRFEIGTNPRPRIQLKRKKRHKTSWIYSLVVIVLTLGGAAYFVQKETQPEVDSAVSSMNVTYRCAKCGNTFELTVSAAAQMRQSRGEIVCPSCGALGAEKQDVSVVVSGDETTPTGPASASGPPAKPQVTLQRTLNNP